MSSEELSWVGTLGRRIGVAEDALRLIIGMILGKNSKYINQAYVHRLLEYYNKYCQIDPHLDIFLLYYLFFQCIRCSCSTTNLDLEDGLQKFNTYFSF